MAAPHAPTWGRLGDADLSGYQTILAVIVYDVQGNTSSISHEV